MAPAVFRVMVSVSDIERATYFYSALFQSPGRRVSPGRHYFDSGSVIFACYDPEEDGDDTPAVPNPEPIYFTVPDVDATLARLRDMGFAGEKQAITVKAWGERSFYMQDPFGNPLCFIDEDSRFTGEPSNVEEKEQEVLVS